MNNNIRRVKLWYKYENKFEADYITHFLRFMGVLVSEDIYTEGSDLSIPADCHYDEIIVYENIPKFDFSGKEEAFAKSKFILKNKFKNYDLLSKILEIYHKNDLFRAFFLRKNFFSKDYKNLSDNSGMKYFESYNELDKLITNEKNSDEYEYLEYAYYYCIYNINKIYNLAFGCYGGLEFDTKKVVNEIYELQKKYSDFDNLYVLGGNLVNLDGRYFREIFNWYNMFVEHEKNINREILSYVAFKSYYSMAFKNGHLNNEFKEEIFSLLANSSDNSYKNCYISAVRHGVLQKPDIALEFFCKEKRILEQLNHGSYEYLKPIEFIFYYKVLREFGIIGVHLKDSSKEITNFFANKKPIDYFEEAKDFYDKAMKPDNKYLRKLLKKDEVEKYCSSTKSKIDIEVCESDIRLLKGR